MNTATSSVEGPSQADLDRIGWWHTIEFPNGAVTKGQRSRESLKIMEEAVFRDVDLRGKNVVDIGAWNGYYSVQATTRGAKSVTSVDDYIWDRRPESYQGFQIVRKHLMPECRVIKSDVMNMSAERHGTFDVTLFFGVLYHLKHPLYALERVAEITNECLILETHLDAVEEARPAAIFYPGKELNNDGSNWWGPNQACVEGMLRTVGFSRIVSSKHNKDRGVFHAWK
jgi:tRNA (mo5U34)-methyltransferase